jgi:hypothetical protein
MLSSDIPLGCSAQISLDGEVAVRRDACDLTWTYANMEIWQIRCDALALQPRLPHDPALASCKPLRHGHRRR